MNAAHSPRFEELLPAYALGALDGDDLRELEAHLSAGCAECRRQLDLWERDLATLAASVPPVPPSAVTRQRILKVAGSAERRPTGLPRWFLLPAAALLLLAVWGVAGQMRLRGEMRRLETERDRLAQQVGALESDMARARSDARRMAETLQVIAAPGVRTVSLAGLGPSPGALGHTYVNPSDGSALFYAFDLPPLAPDKTYQLWFIAAGTPVSAGTFAVDPRGTGNLRVDDITRVDDIQAWAVTVEPRGGVPQPTGAMVLKG
ncbi:MAG TPA: anti-sigma factor [Thermoanaerobaculia bacterium]|nr:anti-sigma factor [Thermoanaerobaculia bacterium]